MTTLPALFASAYVRAGHALPEASADPGVCELCGHEGERVRWRPKSSWTAHSTHAYPGTGAICLGCELLLNGRIPGAQGADARAGRWTPYTLAADGRHCAWLRTSEKPAIAAWVARHGAIVSVTSTGKAQLGYLARARSIGGAVSAYLDGDRVCLDQGRWRALAYRVEVAYRAGVPKVALLAEHLPHASIRRLGRDRARWLESDLSAHRHTAALRLAVWLATKEDE